MGDTMSNKWRSAEKALETDKKTEKELEESQRKLKIYEALDAQDISREIPAYKPGKGEATVIALASDWHVEERVDRADIPGAVNEYNPEIARKRSEQFFQRVVLLADAERSLYGVETLVLGLLGDIIHGYLHDDQRESNFMSPTEAIIFAEELLTIGIEYILEHGNFKRIIIPCCCGNHGRTTVKPRAKTYVQNSYEWLMYQHLASRFAKEKRIHWEIAGGAHVYLEVAGRVCRFHHGDDVRYVGGVGGLSIPLMKAIAQWNKVRRADYDFLGHYHQCRDFGSAVVNGSLIGYNAYALKAKCDYEPPKQQFITIDHTRGKCCAKDIWTDYLP